MNNERIFGSAEFVPFREDDRLVSFIGSVWIYRDAQRVTLQVRPHEQAANPMGILHGGALATLFDVAMYEMATSNGKVVTVAQEVKFLRTITVAEPLYIETEPLKSGRTTVFCAARAWQMDKLCGYAAAQFARV